MKMIKRLTSIGRHPCYNEAFDRHGQVIHKALASGNVAEMVMIGRKRKKTSLGMRACSFPVH